MTMTLTSVLSEGYETAHICFRFDFCPDPGVERLCSYSRLEISELFVKPIISNVSNQAQSGPLHVVLERLGFHSGQMQNSELTREKSRHHSYVTEGVKIVLNSTNRVAWTLTLHHLSFPLQASFLLTHNLYWLPVSPVLLAWFCLPFIFHREKLDVNVLEVFWGCLLRCVSHRDTCTHTPHTHTLLQELECSLML